MEYEWQVCELEDGTKWFVEYTVAAIPENWIFREEDGTVWCFWPKKKCDEKNQIV